MSNPWNSLVAVAAGLSDRETQVAYRGFDVRDPDVVDRLERIGRQFVWGYNRALRCASLDALAQELSQGPLHDAGFFYEGAAMGLAVRDWLTPWARLLDAYIAGPAHHHSYMAWVGMGWAFARLPMAPMRVLSRASGLSRWLALDGYGFHQGYFGWRKFIVQGRRPSGLPQEALRVFDQGLGRSLWFVKGADPAAVAAQIGRMGAARHADLWAGAGLACAYAGGASEPALRAMVQVAGVHFPALAQGVVFAAEARRRAGNPVAHTEAVCRAVLGLDATPAADIALACMPSGETLADYHAWREAVQQRFSTPSRPEGGQ